MFEVAFDEFGAEAVDAGGDGCVRGEEVAGGGGLEGGREVEAEVFAEAADAFEADEGGVSFVDVEDGGSFADFVERADASDAEDDFLLDACVDVAAVEVFGDVAVVAVVLGHVGVEEVEGDAADVALPDADGDGAAWEFDVDAVLLAGVGVDEAADGLVGEVDVGVGFLLVAVGVEVLVEVAAAVEEADADEGESEFAGGLDVVAGEASESAGVDLEALGEAELCGEVGDAHGLAAAVVGVLGFEEFGVLSHEPGATLAVLLEAAVDEIEGVEIGLVGGVAVEEALVAAAEELDGVVVGLFPELAVEADEEFLSLGVPGPPEVVCDFEERLEGFREIGNDAEASNVGLTGMQHGEVLGRWRLRGEAMRGGRCEGGRCE